MTMHDLWKPPPEKESLKDWGLRVVVILVIVCTALGTLCLIAWCFSTLLNWGLWL